MSSIGTNLLFLHGHIHDPALARRLANAPAAPQPKQSRGKHQRIRLSRAVLASLHARWCAGVGESRECTG